MSQKKEVTDLDLTLIPTHLCSKSAWNARIDVDTQTCRVITIKPARFVQAREKVNSTKYSLCVHIVLVRLGGAYVGRIGRQGSPFQAQARANILRAQLMGCMVALVYLGCS